MLRHPHFDWSYGKVAKDWENCKFSNFLIIGMPSENEVSSVLVSVRLILTLCIKQGVGLLRVDCQSICHSRKIFSFHYPFEANIFGKGKEKCPRASPCSHSMWYVLLLMHWKLCLFHSEESRALSLFSMDNYLEKQGLEQSQMLHLDCGKCRCLTLNKLQKRSLQLSNRCTLSKEDAEDITNY